MEEPFIITVSYKGEVKGYGAQLVKNGFMHRFHVLVDDVKFCTK